MSETTSLVVVPRAPEPTVEEVRLEISRARSLMVRSAEALRADLGFVARAKETVGKHPWLALGAAFALGLLIAGPRRTPADEGD